MRRLPLGITLGLLACSADPTASSGTDSSTGSSSGTDASTDTSTGVVPTTSTTNSPTGTTDSCTIGAEGCPCTQGGACDTGLACLSQLCVDPGSVTSSTGTGTTTDATTSTTGTTTDGTTTDGTTGTMGGWDGDYPSCQSLAPDACGGDDCCAVDAVPGGWFAMGRGEQASCVDMPVAGEAWTTTTATCLDGGTTWSCPTGTWLDLGGDDDAGGGGADELPEHAVRVDFYGLDRYEVTVSRVRSFVEGYDKASLLDLLDGGAGAHPALPATAWDSNWDNELPDDAAALRAELDCNPIHTWTDDPSGNETFPINCASWYLAYAFCAWDEARLPTEAEWERAATGGDENRLYPWGVDAPSDSLANYKDSDNTPEVDVSAKPDGAGRWAHHQLAGSVWEWVHDRHDPGFYAGAGSDCDNCVNLGNDGAKVMRGGDFQYNAISLRAAERFPGTAGAAWLGAGIRCARD